MDDGERLQRIHVVQGGQAVSADPTACMTTVLGSCVAACLWDAQQGLGGMNHFLLPEAPHGSAADERYGVQAMEMLINGLLKRGASRDRLRAKVFGGARMTAGLMDIGARNGAFVRQFLTTEGIRLESASLGGERARRIQFWPVSGRARQHVIEHDGGLQETPNVRPTPGSGVLELFR